MIRLEVDRGGGQGFVLLATDTTPNYTDTEPLPATPTKWTYRGMYYVGDQPVGQWSDETSLFRCRWRWQFGLAVPVRANHDQKK